MTPDDVVIYVPTRGRVHYRTVGALWAQTMYAHAAYGEPFDIRFVQETASVEACRGKIVHDFLVNTDKQALIMVDDDVVLPDGFVKLLDDLEDFPVVGLPCLVVRPGQIHTPNVYWWNKDLSKYEIRAEAFSADGLIEVDAVGAGCLGVRREVVSKIKTPFRARVDRYGMWDAGEDFEFCRRAKAAGFRVAADMGLFCDHISEIAGNSLSGAYLEVINAVQAPERESADEGHDPLRV